MRELQEPAGDRELGPPLDQPPDTGELLPVEAAGLPAADAPAILAARPAEPVAQAMPAAAAAPVAIAVPETAAPALPAVQGDGPGARGLLASVEGALAVGHVADSNRRYPGETVTLLTRVDVRAPVPGFTLSIQVPAGLEIDRYRAAGSDQMPLFRLLAEPPVYELAPLPGADGEPFPVAIPGQPRRLLAPLRTGRELIWRVAEPQPAGARHEYEITALVLPAYQDVSLRSMATVAAHAGDLPAVAAETAEIAVSVRGRYLEHLPALYEQDSFMGRFLMLFESFWRPISQQIDSIHVYFDPDMTPARFLPWLATWFDLELDESWPEAQQRALLKEVIWLYRKRGTRGALQRYLEIYTRGRVEITERRAKNLKLGRTGRLGAGVALGTANVPFTFTVRVTLPPLAPPANLTGEAAAAELARLEKRRRRMIERIIEAEKPGHTSYRLEIETVETWEG
jgi:phage tail-like protein